MLSLSVPAAQEVSENRLTTLSSDCIVVSDAVNLFGGSLSWVELAGPRFGLLVLELHAAGTTAQVEAWSLLDGIASTDSFLAGAL